MCADPIDDLPPLREVIARYNLGARKSLGQNFLLDMNLTDKIVRNIGDITGRSIVEVGPGPGGLTRSILRAGAGQVIAIERDRRCIEALEDLVQAANGRLKVIEADALAVDEIDLIDRKSTIIANLPYNIATPLLFKWLATLDNFSEMVLMFQKEVADRICASPGNKIYGRLSVMTQWHCEVEKLFDLPARAFVPPPKVISSVVRLRARNEPPSPADPTALGHVVAAAFGQRRKMLRTALKSVFADPNAALNATGIDPSRRAETLQIEEFCALARQLKPN